MDLNRCDNSFRERGREGGRESEVCPRGILVKSFRDASLVNMSSFKQMVTLSTKVSFELLVVYKTGGTALRQLIDPHSTSACGLSGVTPCPRGSPTSVTSPTMDSLV
jgi:hypothetical protein